jgi:hypothetical protein
MGGACSMNVGVEECTKGIGEEARRKDTTRKTET